MNTEMFQLIALSGLLTTSALACIDHQNMPMPIYNQHFGTNTTSTMFDNPTVMLTQFVKVLLSDNNPTKTCKAWKSVYDCATNQPGGQTFNACISWDWLRHFDSVEENANTGSDMGWNFKRASGVLQAVQTFCTSFLPIVNEEWPTCLSKFLADKYSWIVITTSINTFWLDTIGRQKYHLKPDMGLLQSIMLALSTQLDPANVGGQGPTCCAHWGHVPGFFFCEFIREAAGFTDFMLGCESGCRSIMYHNCVKTIG